MAALRGGAGVLCCAVLYCAVLCCVDTHKSHMLHIMFTHTHFIYTSTLTVTHTHTDTLTHTHSHRPTQILPPPTYTRTQCGDVSGTALRAMLRLYLNSGSLSSLLQFIAVLLTMEGRVSPSTLRCVCAPVCALCVRLCVRCVFTHSYSITHTHFVDRAGSLPWDEKQFPLCQAAVTAMAQQQKEAQVKCGEHQGGGGATW
jgi:hypothetical protein